VLNIIALFVTFFAICYSLHVRTTDGSSLCILSIKVLFFLIPIQGHLYLVGVSFKLVRMESVKQFLIEVMLFAVALLGVWVGEGTLSPYEAQSKQQQNEKCFKWGKGKNLNFCAQQISTYRV